MLHPSKAGVKRELARRARSIGEFNPRRYFRGGDDLRFYNVGTGAVRDLARALFRARQWSIADAMKLADALVRDPYLETKAAGIFFVARLKRQFEPTLLTAWKRWLADGYAANWATTDALCGELIGPLLEMYPSLVGQVAAWSRHKVLWVRRASAVGLLRPVARGRALDTAYAVARQLHRDPEDLVQKAVGWLLREAGKRDPGRLERYLRANWRIIPRTTFRYAIERYDAGTRAALLALPRTERRVR